MLTPEQRTELQATIEIRIGELEALLAVENEEAKPVSPDVAIGRLSRVDSMQGQQMALELRRRQQSELERLRGALARIEEPIFGTCLLCRKPIAFERLLAVPDASMCVACSR